MGPAAPAEEHFITGDVLATWAGINPRYGNDSTHLFPSDSEVARRLEDLSNARLDQTDAAVSTSRCCR